MFITTEKLQMDFHEVTEYCYGKPSSHFSIHFDQMIYWLFDMNIYMLVSVQGVHITAQYIHGSYGL